MITVEFTIIFGICKAEITAIELRILALPADHLSSAICIQCSLFCQSAKWKDKANSTPEGQMRVPISS